MITENDMIKLQEKVNEAESDTTPFAVIDSEGEVSVVGDANKTERKSKDYTVVFRVPSEYKDLLPDAESLANGKYFVSEVHYHNVIITPRKDLKICSSIMKLLPFLREVLPSGETKDRDKSEISKIISDWVVKDYIVDAMYDLVASVIGIDDFMKEMMFYDSVIENVFKILTDFPEIVNESDFFTAQLPSMRKKEAK